MKAFLLPPTAVCRVRGYMATTSSYSILICSSILMTISILPLQFLTTVLYCTVLYCTVLHGHQAIISFPPGHRQWLAVLPLGKHRGTHPIKWPAFLGSNTYIHDRYSRYTVDMYVGDRRWGRYVKEYGPKSLTDFILY